jgi:hypothetical protein
VPGGGLDTDERSEACAAATMRGLRRSRAVFTPTVRRRERRATATWPLRSASLRAPFLLDAWFAADGRSSHDAREPRHSIWLSSMECVW